jgi:hypothetical protein
MLSCAQIKFDFNIAFERLNAAESSFQFCTSKMEAGIEQPTQNIFANQFFTTKKTAVKYFCLKQQHRGEPRDDNNSQ